MARTRKTSREALEEKIEIMDFLNVAVDEEKDEE